MKEKIRARYIGDSAFYKMVLTIAVPIMVQSGITNFVGMLDNIMIGRIGTDQMSGVSIVNSLLFVFNLCIFGGLAGIGIFTSQFFGSGDHDGIRYTFRSKIFVAAFVLFAGLTVFLLFGTQLISLYLHEDGGTADATATLGYAREYLQLMLLQMVPFAIGQVYSSTLRETGETILPMKASVAAVFVNLAGNWILIFGNLGAPKLGVSGAAIATIISRLVELSILIAWTHKNSEKNPYIVGVYRSLKVPSSLFFTMILKGLPLLFNEALWSLGMAVLTQNYSLRGLTVIAAMNIAQTLSNVFSIFFITMGSAIAIILGQQLGAGRLETAKDYSVKLTFFTIVLCTGTGLLQVCAAPFFPHIYNTTADVRYMATGIIVISGLFSPVFAFENAAYFTIRSGGKTVITFLFDCMFSWVVSIPVLFCLVRFTDLPLLPMYAIVQCLEFVKCGIGYALMKKGIWVQDLTSAHKKEA